MLSEYNQLGFAIKIVTDTAGSRVMPYVEADRVVEMTR